MQLLDYLIQISVANIEILTSACSCHNSCLTFYDKQLQGLEDIVRQLNEIKQDNLKEDSNVNG